MIHRNQQGSVSGLAVSELLTIMLLFAALGFGVWAYSQMQDYKNNVDSKITVATEKARQAEAATKSKEFAEKEKSPLKAYNGPEAFGSIALSYPKTWSGYVDATGTGTFALDGYFSPGVVPSITSQTSVFALRLQVVHMPYAQVLDSMKSQQQAGKLTAAAFALQKLPKVVGVKLSGQFPNQKNATMVLLPLRTDTIEISTEGSLFVNDFNNIILPSMTFSP